MSVEQHQSAARSDDQQASAEQSLYNPHAHAFHEMCSGGTAHSEVIEPCWTEDVNPTERHLREAEHLRNAAAHHRTLSNALAAAEAQACVGVSEHDRDVGPLSHPGDILAVEEIAPNDNGHREGGVNIIGYRVVYRPVQGLTVHNMQRLVDCHMARVAAMGYDVPEMNDCPLVAQGIRAQVVETPAGIAIDLVTRDLATLRDLRARAERLRRLVVDASPASGLPGR
jgi:hypothetical protein